MSRRSTKARPSDQVRRAPALREGPAGAWAPPAWLLAIGLVLLTLVPYGPVLHAGFIWDDDAHVTNNTTLRNLSGLTRIWLEPRATPQYYPLIHTSFWLEYHLWGQDPVGYHVVNVLLHAANALLLGLVLRRLDVPGSFWAAALFAVHPVHVESVAWISERKNVLSTLCYLGSFLAFLRCWPPEESRPRPARRGRFYGLTLLLFLAALLSKTVTCSLPAAFLLVRWWKQGRISARDLLVTAPLFLLGLGLALNTVVLEKDHVGARGAEWHWSAVERVLIAGRATWFYVGKLAWPESLAFIYPRWQIGVNSWWQYGFPLAVLAVLLALYGMRRRLGRGPLAAGLFFVGTLVPALGFFDVYPMRYSFVADHFQYLASAGLLALFAAGLAWTLARANSYSMRFSLVADPRRYAAAVVPCAVLPAVAAAWVFRRPGRGPIACALGLSLLAALAGLTWRQSRSYADSEALWTDTLAKNPSCWLAHYNFGNALAGRGQIDAAIAHYRKALEIKPDSIEGHSNLGVVLASRGQFDEAIAHYRKALEINPRFAVVHDHLGDALAHRGQLDEASEHFRKALELRPNDVDAHINFGNALAGRGQVEEATAHYRKALEIEPNLAEAHSNLGAVLAGRGQLEEALAHYRKALEIKPDYVEAHFNLGVVLAGRGQVDEALEHYEKALGLAVAGNDGALAHSIRVRIRRLRP